MGLFNWLQKNGPGSPGSTAKAIAKIYNSLPVYDSGYPGYVDKNYGFVEIIEMRKLAEKQLGTASLLARYDTNELVRQSMGHMSLLVFQIMYLETSQFRSSLTSEEMIKSTLSTIENAVNEVLPNRESIEMRFGSDYVVAVNFMMNNKPL